MSFTDTFTCRSRAHCDLCRSSGEFRAHHGAPDVCPFTNISPEPKLPTEEMGAGPGTELKAILAGWNIVPGESCQCNALAREMNEKGVQWCEAHLDHITSVMAAEANRRGWMKSVPFKKLGARQLVRLAIKRARARAASHPSPTTL